MSFDPEIGEALARRTADHHVGHGNLARLDRLDVAEDSVTLTKVRGVGRSCVQVEFDRKDRGEILGGKTRRHAPQPANRSITSTTW